MSLKFGSNIMQAVKRHPQAAIYAWTVSCVTRYSISQSSSTNADHAVT